MSSMAVTNTGILDVSQEIFLGSREVAEAADGRFFDALEPYNLSDNFWEAHKDLMPEGFGSVIQLGVLSDGSWTNPEDHTREATWSLKFDARERKSGIYTWQLAVAEKQGETITISQLRTSRWGARTKAYKFKAAQGLNSITNVDSCLLQNQINLLLNLPQFEARVAVIRRDQVKYRDDLAQFINEKPEAKWNPRYAQELEKRKQTARDMGFEPALPYAPSLFEQERLKTQTETMEKWLGSLGLRQ